MHRDGLDDILQRAIRGCSPSHQELVQLLALEEPEHIQNVMAAARTVREQHFGHKIFLYGFIYLSTYCRNHCAFCFYREGNRVSPRYRKTLAEVLEISHRLVDSGVHLVDLTLGEDPLIHNTGDFKILLQMIEGVKQETGIPVMISPGVVPDKVLMRFADIQTDWYALYQETHNPVLFAKLRIAQSFKERAAKRAAAYRAGMLVEDGMLLGVGETLFDRADSIEAMRQSDVHQIRVMSLVPQAQTPLAHMPSLPRVAEGLCIAVMRLAMPDRLIPASLDVDGIQGLEMRLDAGANVVTSIIPPRSKLAGVSQCSLDIEQGLRSVPQVKHILKAMGLKAAAASDYAAWIAAQKKNRSAGQAWCEYDRCRKMTPTLFIGNSAGQYPPL